MANKTPVTILQEYMIQRQNSPTYNLICNDVGTHEPLFKYQVTGLGHSAIGSGKSKREAKHEAARLLLQRLKADVQQVSDPNKNHLLKGVDDCCSPYDDTIKDNAVGALQVFCCDYQLQMPKYDLILDIGPAHSKLFTIRCSVSSFSYESTARTKKQAKQRCSAGILEKLKLCLIDYLDITDLEAIGPSDGHKSKSCDLAKRTAYLGLPFPQIFTIFKSSHYPESPTLQTIKDKYRENLQDISSPVTILKSVGEELNFELDITKLPSMKPNIVVVNIFLVAKPGWSFISFADNYEAAINLAACKVFEFLIEMTS